MKQISNWIFGSFFRTIGRLLVFVLLGVLIAHFVDFGSLKDNFSITNLLGIETIKASSFSQQYSTWYKENGSGYSASGGFSWATVTGNGNADYYTQDFYYGTNNNTLNVKNYDYLEFQVSKFLYKGSSIYEIGDITSSQMRCNVHNVYEELGSQVVEYTDFEYHIDYFTCPASSSDTTTYTDKINVSIQPRIYYGSGGWSICKFTYCTDTNCTLRCDLANNHKSSGFKGIRFFTKTMGRNTTLFTDTYNYTIGLSNGFNSVISDTTQITGEINSQTQQQQQQHNETMNYLEDSNTTQAESEASDFFSDFEVEDHGGLSGIITAPLSTIQSLLNNTCTNLVLPLPFVNENLTLPCMNSIYTEHFGAFFTIYQTIILAIISYRCLRSLFYDVRGFINPDDDRIEVMDL